jgi:hypothetical protein
MKLRDAMFDVSMPVNPIPFANGLADLVRENGTMSIQSDDAKRILWVLIAQSYGCLATVSLDEEWDRLRAVAEGEIEGKQ